MPDLELFPKTYTTAPWHKNGLKLLCACSGGLDSTALLHLLVSLPDVEVAVAHFNHQLRGQESESDQDFVMDLAQQYDLDIHIVSENITEYAREHHLSIEEAGSRRRKAQFLSILKRIGFDYVVTGQHLDDQIETILMNLYHGTGIRGLVGMGESHGRFLRPLLPYTRKQLAEYSKNHHLTHRVDKSNESLHYLRNNIRSKLVPHIRSGESPQLEGLIQELSDRGAILHQKVEKSLEVTDNIDDSTGHVIKIPLGMGKLSDYFSPIQKVIFDSAFQAISLMPQGLSEKHFQSLKSLIVDTAIGKEIQLPASVTAFRNRFSIVLFRKTDFRWVPSSMKVADKVLFPFFRFEYCEEFIHAHIKEAEYFWYSHDPDQYRVRQTRDGDMMMINDTSKRVSVRQILQEAHVAPHLKQFYPVLEYAGEIQWIPGIRTSELAMVDLSASKENEIKRCMRVEFQKGTHE